MPNATAGVPSGLQLTDQPCPVLPVLPVPGCSGMYLPWAPPTASPANWQVTMPRLCPSTMMLPVIYRSFYSSCKEAVNYRRGIN